MDFNRYQSERMLLALADYEAAERAQVEALKILRSVCSHMDAAGHRTMIHGTSYHQCRICGDQS